MTVAALIGLGVPKEKLIKALQSIPVKDFDIEITEVKKSGLLANDFNVILKEDNHDHDMEYLHGHSHHHEHHHSHRGLKEIKKIIAETQVSEKAKKIAKKIFKILAEAEAKVHGTKIDEVHFHEVGATDSIVDIIAIAFCLDYLNLSEVVVSPLYEGKGMIRCQHGLIPIPAPATLNIVSDYKLNLHLTDVEGELVTPTGAATIAAIKTGDKLPNNYEIVKVGIGAGKRKYETAGILRAMIIKEGEGH